MFASLLLPVDCNYPNSDTQSLFCIEVTASKKSYKTSVILALLDLVQGPSLVHYDSLKIYSVIVSKEKHSGELSVLNKQNN